MSFNFMGAVTICSDFGAQKIKSLTVSTVAPSILSQSLTLSDMRWIIMKPIELNSAYVNGFKL